MVSILCNVLVEYLLAVAGLAEGELIDSLLVVYYDPLLFKIEYGFKLDVGSEGISTHAAGV